tara:strand:+ start:262 stop:696 length:435 start_codon:yes stop_codon:yes gene_type:complete
MNLWVTSLCLLVGVPLAVLIIPRVVVLIAPRARPAAKRRPMASRRWRRRTYVVVPCVIAGLTITALAASSFDSIDAWLWSLMGPFGERAMSASASWAVMIVHGGMTLFGMSLHPIWPNVLTACVTIVASGWWFLIGLAFTYSSV